MSAATSGGTNRLLILEIFIPCAFRVCALDAKHGSAVDWRSPRISGGWPGSGTAARRQVGARRLAWRCRSGGDMGTIEHRVEAPDRQPDYSGKEFSAEEVAKGLHRGFVGGVWDSHGLHQLE